MHFIHHHQNTHQNQKEKKINYISHGKVFLKILKN